MLTEEQIKSLKPGDPIVINTTFSRVDADGDIRFNTPSNNGSNYEPFVDPDCVSIPPEHVTSLPTVKYSSTRLFREGDKVRYCERDGRKIFRLQDGAIYEVKSDEGDAGTVEIWLCKEVSRYGSYPYNVFELVTPVEELEPFYVDYITQDDDDLDDNPRWCVKYRKYDDIVSVFYRNGFEPQEKTRAAAEAERDRLNAEYRKEQK